MRKPIHPGHALATIFFAGVLSLHQNAAGATTRTWSGGASMDPGWSNPANWVNGVPMAGD